MANSIELAGKFLPIIDEIYKNSAVTTALIQKLLTPAV